MVKETQYVYQFSGEYFNRVILEHRGERCKGDSHTDGQCTAKCVVAGQLW